MAILFNRRNCKFLLCLLIIIANPSHSSRKNEIDYFNDKPYYVNFPKSQLQFAPGTIGAVIANGGDRVYKINVSRGQYVKLELHTAGARANVCLISPTGKELACLTNYPQQREAKVFSDIAKESGIYQIVCYGGPTAHAYNFTIEVE